MTDRRGFLGAILAMAASPAIVRADSLMKVISHSQLILWGDGIHDDREALQALIDGKSVRQLDKSVFARYSNGDVFLGSGVFALGAPIVFPRGNHIIKNCFFEALNKSQCLIKLAGTENNFNGLFIPQGPL